MQIHSLVNFQSQSFFHNSFVLVSCPYNETAACFTARVLHHRHKSKSAKKQVVFHVLFKYFCWIKSKFNPSNYTQIKLLTNFIIFQLQPSDLSLWGKMANYFRSFMSNLRVFPTVKAQEEEEEELVDQQDHLRVSTFLFPYWHQTIFEGQCWHWIFPFLLCRRNVVRNHTPNICWRNIRHVTTVSTVALKQPRPASKKFGITCML